MVSSESQAHQRLPEASIQTLLAVVRQLVIELHPHKHNALTVTLDSTLEHDLGFDSLGRMELLVYSCQNRSSPRLKCSAISCRLCTGPVRGQCCVSQRQSRAL